VVVGRVRSHRSPRLRARPAAQCPDTPGRECKSPSHDGLLVGLRWTLDIRVGLANALDELVVSDQLVTDVTLPGVSARPCPSGPDASLRADRRFAEEPIKLTRGDLMDPSEAEHIAHVISLLLLLAPE
jgi:hypothetical protein